MTECHVFLCASAVSGNGPWKEVVSETLEDSRQQKDPLPQQEFPFPTQTGRYVKLEVVSYYGHGGGLQHFNIIGPVVISSVQGEWTQNGHPKNAWAAKNVLRMKNKGEKEQEGKDGIYNYWLLPDGAKNKGFTLDLGIVKDLNLVRVVNTHSANWRDRATKKFNVYVR